MKKMLLVAGAFILSILLFSSPVHADNVDGHLKEIGFQEGLGAVNEYKQSNTVNLPLPKLMPPVSFTKVYSRFQNNQGVKNDSVEIVYKNHLVAKQHYLIRVSHIESSVPISITQNTTEVKLKDGSSAYYLPEKVKGFNLFVFKRNQFQYVIGINKEMADVVTIDKLKEIANSI